MESNCRVIVVVIGGTLMLDKLVSNILICFYICRVYNMGAKSLKMESNWRMIVVIVGTLMLDKLLR